MYANPYIRAIMRPQRLAAGITVFSLIAAVTALVACALPVLIITVGYEAALAARTETALFLRAVEYRNWILGISGLLLLLATAAVRNARCPRTLYPEITRQCQRLQHLNQWMLRISAGLWLAGILSVYVVIPVRVAPGW